MAEGEPLIRVPLNAGMKVGQESEVLLSVCVHANVDLTNAGANGDLVDVDVVSVRENVHLGMDVGIKRVISLMV